MILAANNEAGLVLTLEDMTAYGGNGPNRPATGISWNEAARFVNWLNEFHGYHPVYRFETDGPNDDISLWPVEQSWQRGEINRFRHKDAYYFIPSEDEWYKAAHYDGEMGDYYDYSTGSDTVPIAVDSGTDPGTAVYGHVLDFSIGPADIKNAGGLSHYGTMGQAGNVIEWTESNYLTPNEFPSQSRVTRGGHWGSPEISLSSEGQGENGVRSEVFSLGFRVAAVSVPSGSGEGPIAWWTFNTPGKVLPGPSQIPDLSGNGNGLSTFSEDTGTTSSDIVWPDSGPGNLSHCFTPNQDLYTLNQPINSHSFSAFTVEAVFRTESLDRYQVIFGLDGKTTSGPWAPLQLKIRDDTDRLVMESVDAAGNPVVIQTLAPLEAGQWYSVAVVNDGATMSLYLKRPGEEYVLQDQTAVDGALHQVPDDIADVATVGRGMYDGNLTDWFQGYIDEIRIYPRALDPSEFLTQPASPIDLEPPTITCPENIVVEADGPDGAIVEFPMPHATDDVDFDLAINCVPASGSLFEIGETTVTCTARDDVGNVSLCQFQIVVQDKGFISDVFTNPILPAGQDPWVVQHGDKYYYCYSSEGAVWVSSAARFQDIGKSPAVEVWRPPANTPYSKDIWAPELHFLEGRWYIYVAADDGNNANHRMYVLQGPQDSPLNFFTFLEKITDPSDKWAIDGTVLNLNGRLYFLWSGWPGDVNGEQNLYIAAMENPWTISGDRVLISTPTHDWEKLKTDRPGEPEPAGYPIVNEGPQALQRNGLTFVVYSAAGSWSDSYSLGRLELTGDDPLDPESWTKHPEPVFSRTADVFGPGHASFVQSPDRSEWWIIYHAARQSGSGWDRDVRAQPFSWDEDGTPQFGTPIPPGRPIPEPSGSEFGRAYEAENSEINNASVIVQRLFASRGQKVGFINEPDSHVDFTVQVPNAARYRIEVRYGAGIEDATHEVTVNGVAVEPISYPFTPWDVWKTSVIEVDLMEGSNQIRFSKGQSFAELDFITVESPEGQRSRHEAEKANLSNVQIINPPAPSLPSSGGKKVGLIDHSDSSLRFDVEAPWDGEYWLDVRYGAGLGDANHRVSVNGVETEPIPYARTDWDNWKTSRILVSLRAGTNSIQLSKDEGYAEVDCIQIVPHEVNAINRAPELGEARAKTAPVGQTTTVPFNATDPDLNDKLTYSLGSGSPTWAHIDPDSGIVSLMPSVNGYFEAIVRVTDDGEPPLSDESILAIEAVNLDFGDAPASYPTLMIVNGANHVIESDFSLGSSVDGDLDGQPTIHADGDDANGIDDEDGVTFITPAMPAVPGGPPVINAKVGASNEITVEATLLAGEEALLNAWLDYNRDGDWLDTGEQILTNEPIANGTKNFQFVVPANAAIDPGPTFARFRLSSLAGLGPADDAPDGEVEDYEVALWKLDFGDALAAHGPAPHTLPKNPTGFLGGSVDDDLNYQTHPNAEGDDTDADGDDDDGVIFRSPLIAGLLATVEVTASEPGLLDIWIDYNGVGGFERIEPYDEAKPSEYVNDRLQNPSDRGSPISLQTGLNIVRFFVPNKLVSQPAMARFRFFQNLPLGVEPGPSALVYDGEVEDYEVQLFDLLTDFGDAPDSQQAPQYPTLLINDGAFHLIETTGYHLGAKVDVEINGFPGEEALGDDLDDGRDFPETEETEEADDEDGVEFPAELIQGETATIQVTATMELITEGKLSAWFDFNGDGDWLDGGEQVLTDVELSDGIQTFDIPIPGNAKLGRTYARFRMNRFGGLSPSGFAETGEVEDYAVEITPPNQPPKALDDVFSVRENSTNSLLEVLGNQGGGPDSDVDGAALTIIAVDSPGDQGGTISVNATQDALIYTPSADFLGDETFTYTIEDDDGAQDTATVTVHVIANPPPVARDDNFPLSGSPVIQEDSQDNLLPVLADNGNGADSDPEAESISIVAVQSPSNQGGVVGINVSEDGLLYAPAADFSGSDTFTYAISDGVSTATATVTVEVAEINDPPIIGAIEDQSIDENLPGQPSSSTVSFTVDDVETGLNDLILTPASSNAALVPIANISFGGSDGLRTATIVSAEGQSGTAQITIEVSDGEDAASTTFELTVHDLLAVAGVVEDGLVAGGTVFFDANFNGVRDGGEPSTQTDQAGGFNLIVPIVDFDVNGNGMLDPDEGRYVLTGGTDIATGLPLPVFLTAPPSATVVNPLTSLIMTLLSRDPGLTPAEAEQLVESAFGIDANLAAQIDLLHFNIFLSAAADDPNAAPILYAASQLQDTLLQVAHLLDGAAGQGIRPIFDTVMGRLAALIESGAAFDSTDEKTLAFLIQSAAADLGANLNQEQVSAAATIIQTNNDAKKELAESGISPSQAAFEISQVQGLAQSQIAEDLNALGAGTLDAQDAVVKNTGAALSEAIDASPVGDLVGNENRTGTFSFKFDRFAAKENGTAVQPVTIVRTDGNSGAVNLVVTPAADTASAPGDFNAGPVNVAFSDLEISKTLDVSGLIVDDNAPEGTESIDLNLALEGGAPADAALGQITNAKLDIIDNELAGTFAFSSNQFRVKEGGAPVNGIVLARTGGSLGAVTLFVTPSAIPGQAEEGVDFDSQPIAVTFADGSLNRLVPAPFINDSAVEEDEDLTLTLSLDPGAPSSAALGAVAVASLTIENDDFNTPPTITAFDDQTTLEDRALGPIAFTVGDAETDPSDLTVSAESSNQELAPDGNIQIIGEGADRSLSIALTPERSGEATITVRVSDGELVTAGSFTVTVDSSNDIPSVISGLSDAVIDEDSFTEIIQFRIADADDALSDLEVSVHSSNQGLVSDANITLSQGAFDDFRRLSITPEPDGFGTSTITVVVSDGKVQSETSFLLTVNDVNDPPFIGGVEDQFIGEDRELTAGFMVGDLETPLPELEISVQSSNAALIDPSKVKFEGSGVERILRVTPEADQHGETVLTLTVNDGTLVAEASFPTTVWAENDAPVISGLEDASVDEDGSVNLNFGVDDAETFPGDLQLSVRSLSEFIIGPAGLGLTGDEGERAITVTPLPDAHGEAEIELKVDDGEIETLQILKLSVLPVNDPPTIAPVPDTTTKENETVRIPVTIRDADNAPEELTTTVFSFNSTLIPQENMELTGEGSQMTLTIAPAANQSGVGDIRVQVSDPSGVTIRRNFKVDVTAVIPTPADLSIRIENGKAIISWEGDGTLELSPNVEGPYIPVPNASNPHEMEINTTTFFKVK